jgi:hypothetical protein
MIRFAGSQVKFPQIKPFTLTPELEKSLDISAQGLLGAILKRYAPHSKTGKLLKSWKISSPDSYTRIVSSDDPAAWFIDHGTKFHVIRPKNKKALSWLTDEPEDPDDLEDPGQLRIARKYARVGGIKPHGYIQAAEEEVWPLMERAMLKAVRTATNNALGNFEGAAISRRSGDIFYGRRGAGGRFAPRPR